MRGPILLLAAMLWLSGCMTDEPGDGGTPTTTTTGPSIPDAFAVDNGASGCYEAVGLLLVDIAQAQRGLPANWTAADASLAIGSPQPTGKGAIWFNGYTCTNATAADGGALEGAEVGILVMPPRLSDNTTSNATFNVYQVLHLTDADRLHEALGSVGVESQEVNVTVKPGQAAANAQRATITVANATATAYEFEFAALLPDTLTGSGDFWRETPDGLVLFHYEISDRAFYQGTVVSCTFTDPQVRAITGTGTCGPGQALVLVIPDQAWTSELRWMPGIHAVAG